MDGWIDGWVDGWVHRLTDGRMALLTENADTADRFTPNQLPVTLVPVGASLYLSNLSNQSPSSGYLCLTGSLLLR